MPEKNESNEICIVRVYDAPVQAVWDAWCDPKQAEKWWGPRGFTLTTHSKDLRVGGHWHYTMHGPDGVDYENRAVYHDVTPYSRLEYDHGGSIDRPPLFRVCVTFQETDGKTTMDMRMILATPEAAKETKKFIKKAGGNGTWDRLGEYLVSTRSKREIFMIHRTIDVDVQTVFRDIKQHFECNRFDAGEICNFSANGTGCVLFYLRLDERLQEGGASDESGVIDLKTTVQATSEGANVARIRIICEPENDPHDGEVGALCKIRERLAAIWNTELDRIENRLIAVGQRV